VAVAAPVAQLYLVVLLFQPPAIPELVVGPLFLLVARQLSQITGRSQGAVAAVVVGLAAMLVPLKFPHNAGVVAVAVVAQGSMAVLAALVGLVQLPPALPVIRALVRLVELVVREQQAIPAVRGVGAGQRVQQGPPLPFLQCSRAVQVVQPVIISLETHL
jgi:hypothetical protein